MAQKLHGRPTKYKPEYCEELIAHFKKAKSFVTFAAVINVNPDTINEWVKAHPEFAAAKKLGKAFSLEKFEEIGMAMMLGKVKGAQPSMWNFMMKNHFGWADKIEVTDDDQVEEIEFIE